MFLPNKMVLSMTKLLNMDAGPSDVRPIFGKNFLRKHTHFYWGFFHKKFPFFSFPSQFPNKKCSTSKLAKKKQSFLEGKKAFFMGPFFFSFSIGVFCFDYTKRKTKEKTNFFFISMSWKNKHLVPIAPSFTFLEKIISMMP